MAAQRGHPYGGTRDCTLLRAQRLWMIGSLSIPRPGDRYYSLLLGHTPLVLSVGLRVVDEAHE